MILSPTDTVFNENSGDIDFRVESDGNTHMLFVDAGNDRVMVGKSSTGLANQGVEFEDGQIKGTATGQTVAFFNRASDDGAIAEFRKDNSSVGSVSTNSGALVLKGASTSAPVQLQTHDGNEDIEVDPDGFIKFETAGNERWRIDSNGVLVSGGNTAVGIGGTPGDANFAEIGPGFINLARDDTADADQILFGKNGAVHSRLETTSSTLNIQPVENVNITVNEDSVNSDFRVEGNGVSHLLFVDAANDKVGIGVSDPGGLPLHLKVASGDNKLRMETANKDAFVMELKDASGDLHLGTNTTASALVIKDDGKVGIGQTGPLAHVHIKTGTNTPLLVESTSGGGGYVEYRLGASGAVLGYLGSAAELIVSGSSSDLGIRSQGAINLASNGSNSRMTISSSGITMELASGAGNADLRYNTGNEAVTFDTSSERFKENIRDNTSYGLTAVNALQSRMFEYKDGGRTDVGLIAEEVVKVVPELVGLDNEGNPLTVDYTRFVSVLVKAVQEQQALIETLTDRIAALENN